MNPIERKILVCAVESKLDPEQRPRIKELVQKAVINNLIDMAIREGLGSLLYKSLVRAGAIESLGKEHKSTLESYYYRTVAFNLRLINDLREVLFEFNGRKIRPVLLQGICLLQDLYKDIGLRPMSDIDLLVLSEEYPEVIAVLADQGYKRDAVYPNTFRRGSTTLDLHTQIMWADRIRARSLLLGKGEQYIYQETKVVKFEDQEALRLSPCDEVLYLGLHALKHRVNRLIWLVDIRYLLADWGDSDWELLVRRANQLGQEKTLSIILFLLFRALDFRPPGAFRHLMERNRLHFIEKKALEQRLKKASLPAWAPLLLFSPGKGGGGRFSLVLETLFPRPEILRQIFGSSPDLKVWQLYWKRFAQLSSRIMSRRD